MKRKNKRKLAKYISIFLGAALIAQETIPVLAAQEIPTYAEYRSGSAAAAAAEEAGYITISVSTEEELAELAENCKLDTWSGDKQVNLENDIQLETYRDLMIPSFGGIFEGNGYRISGLELTDAGSAVGLFRYLQEGAQVRGLTVEGKVAPEGTRSQVGGIAGVNYGIISGCSFSGSVSGDTEVGGIAGVNRQNGEIRNCKSGAVILGNHSTGGIVGSNQGTVSLCHNTGAVNTFSTEVSYDLEDITVERLEDINSSSNVSAHTDSGGIAGISYGKMYGCTNEGNVGYSHVGYNVGGIAGRLSQGHLAGCTNRGLVLGRKDVGGIAGQMEPFLEVQYLTDKLQELDKETDLFLDLLDASRQDLNDYGSRASDLLGELTGHLDAAGTAGSNLLDTAAELWYLYNNELTGISDDLKTLGDDLPKREDIQITVSGGDLNLDDLKDSISQEERESYLAALEKFGDSAGVHLGNMANASTERFEGFSDNLNSFNDEMGLAGDQLDRLADVLGEGADTTDENVDAVFAQARVLRGLISEIRDELFAYEGITVEDASDEAEEAYYDTASFQKGKIENCSNDGGIEADANVGGIVGQLAIEYDMDPEDDLNYTGEESFNIERTVKAVVRNNINHGDIVSKRDCAGGIVGKAEFGAIISCESYGDVSSTGGSNVGGIAGIAEYAVRGCYSMGSLSGKNRVGGIVGKGCDIFYSYAYNILEVSGESGGAIAGTLKDDGIICGNYYVAGEWGGIDGIDYADGAASLSYEEFCQLKEAPAAFSEFTVAFEADGRELASLQCRYNDSIKGEQIPDIPEKEGYYGVWPEFDFDRVTGSQVLEARYERWVGAVVGEEKDGRGSSLVLVEGQFLPGAELKVQMQGDPADVSAGIPMGIPVEISVMQPVLSKGQILETKESYQGPVTVRVLCEDAEDIAVELEKDGEYRAVPAEAMGSYLVFSMEKPGAFRVTTQENHAMMKGIIAVAVVLIMISAILLIVKARKKHGKGSHFRHGRHSD